MTKKEYIKKLLSSFNTAAEEFLCTSGPSTKRK